MGRAGFAAALSVAVLASGFATSPQLDRATTDRPDEVSGPQVHLVYAVPSDGADRSYDTNGAAAKSFALAQAWLSGETGGQVLRLDTFQGQPDVTFLRLGETGVSLLGRPGPETIAALAAALRAAGFPDTKAYLLYLEVGRQTDGCDGIVGRAGAMRIGGAQLKNPICAQFGGELGTGFGGMAAGWEFGILHEFFHTLGILAPCSPHVVDLNKLFDPTVGHANDNGGGRVDLMADPSVIFASLGSRVVLDVNHDDYYKANIAGCPDLATSGFLVTRSSPPAKTHRLSVSVKGMGTVTSAPAGISCPKRCAATFAAGATVRLSARAAKGWRLSAWSGACTSRGKCSVTLRASAAVRATFARA